MIKLIVATFISLESLTDKTVTYELSILIISKLTSDYNFYLTLINIIFGSLSISVLYLIFSKSSIISKLKSIPLDKGTKYMPPSNLEFTKMNVDNISENVVPLSASAKFNISRERVRQIEEKALEKLLKEVSNIS